MPTVGPATLASALATARPGSVLRLEPGAYRGSVRIDRALSIEALDPERPPTLRGSALGSVVVVDAPPGVAVRLRGLTLTGGKARAGGGVRVDGGQLEVVDCQIERNLSFTEGGGLFARAGSRVRVVRTTFSGNRAMGGGGLCVIDGAEVQILDSRFVGNQARCGGGAAFDSAQARVVGCLFVENEAANNGAGVAVRRGGQVDLDSCVFAWNRRAPALTLEDSLPVLRRDGLLFHGNRGGDFGGLLAGEAAPGSLSGSRPSEGLGLLRDRRGRPRVGPDGAAHSVLGWADGPG